MINVLVNLSALKTGGGQNVALNFLHEIQNVDVNDMTFCFLVANDSEPHRYLHSIQSKKYVIAPSNPILRILFEIFVGWYFLKKLHIDIVYSYFGYAWFPRRWPQISGSADSNLYFPEIDFWGDHHGIQLIKRKLIDIYRICGIKRANAVIFENLIMEKRGRQLYGLKNTKYIMPSIYNYKKNQEYKLSSCLGHDVKRGLFLCGWQLHKNIMLIPLVAAEMKRRKCPMLFIITAPRDRSKMCQQFLGLVQKNRVEDLVLIAGTIHKAELESLYNQVDFIFLLSRLESFSNNIIEAWTFKKPLLVTDALWAHSICHNAAVYVNRDSVIDVADKLCNLLNCHSDYNQLVKNGSSMLRKYPNGQQRIANELEYIRYVYANN